MYRPGSETTGNNDVDSQQGGSYSGDFKENARHGNGIYKLPDGSGTYFFHLRFHIKDIIGCS